MTRIAVLRANALGDLVFSLPALAALRARFPEATITLLGAPWHARELRGRTAIADEVVAIPPVPGLREPVAGERHDPAAVERFLEEMRRRRFDLAVQLHGGGGFSNPFVAALGATLTVGMRAQDAPPLDRTMPYIYYQHEVLRLLEVVALVGAEPVGLEARFPLQPDDLHAAEVALGPEERPLVALHPGANDARRRWPPERFAAVADALSELGAAVVVTGTADEVALVAEAVGRSRAARSLAGRLGIGGLAGLYSRCRLLVANDTGPLHLAAAVGTATVGIFWCGNLINGGPVFRTRHRPQISWTIACPVCGARCAGNEYAAGARCEHDPPFVTDITTEQVTIAARDLYTGLA